MAVGAVRQGVRKGKPETSCESPESISKSMLLSTRSGFLVSAPRRDVEDEAAFAIFQSGSAKLRIVVTVRISAP